MTLPLPGDALLVHRRMTLRSFLAGPITFLICRLIQKRTESPWNHVAVVVGRGRDGWVHIEADFGGVREGNTTRQYLSKPWKYDVEFSSVERTFQHRESGTPLTAQYRDRIVEWCYREDRKKNVYDFKWILMLDLALILYGHKGLKRLRQQNDRAWICSEFVGAAQRAGGYKVIPEREALVPKHFARNGTVMFPLAS